MRELPLQSLCGKCCGVKRVNNDVYWLWLQGVLGEGAMFKELIEEFGSVVNVYNANLIELRMSPNLTPKQINRISQSKLNDFEHIIYDCNRNNWKIISYDNESYPQRLKNIPNPPAVLFVSGELVDIDNSVVIGMVGTRKASEYALRVAHLMSKGISQAGAVVVSGGAIGVDSASHRGALMCGAKTIAVLGCGFGVNYLNENKSLRDSICRNGALVTEYPPFTKASKYTFPLRNRIISGLSLGVTVIEAGEKSGSLITANYALEQGRDVYAVPGSLISREFRGTNKLLADGARLVTEPVHILENYSEEYKIDLSKVKTFEELMNSERDKSANLPDNTNKKDDFVNIDKGREKQLERSKFEASLCGDVKTVYEAISFEFEHIDEIASKCELTGSAVMAAITRLEIMGIAESASGKRYRIKQ